MNKNSCIKRIKITIAHKGPCSKSSYVSSFPLWMHLNIRREVSAIMKESVTIRT